MAKPSSSKKPNPGCGMVVGGKFHDTKPHKVNPLREQFAPTEAQPIRQRARMAGDPAPSGDSELSPGEQMKAKMRLATTKPSAMTDRELEGRPGANDPKSEVGKERLSRVNKEVR